MKNLNASAANTTFLILLFDVCWTSFFLYIHGHLTLTTSLLMRFWNSMMICSTRWDSRGIFALIAFFLLPNWQEQLRVTCNFIATTWSRVWFSNQHYSETDYEDLLSAISQLQCPKPMKYFSTDWKNEPSVLDVPRSNIVAERAARLMEEVYFTCKTDKYLNSKFINTNTHI